MRERYTLLALHRESLHAPPVPADMPVYSSRASRRLMLLMGLSIQLLHAQQTDPLVAAIISRTHIDSLRTFVAELSGVSPIWLRGVQDTIRSRFDTTTGNTKAALYLVQKLQEYGLTPRTQSFDSRGTNVFALQPGVERPAQLYVLCAHYDNAPARSVAPGADDDASGTAAVIEAARLLSKSRTRCSILYALWDREEQGLIGSSFYATQASALGDDILGVINLDMIGWDSNGDMVMDLHTRAVGNSLQLSDAVLSVNTAYGIGLQPVVKNPGSGSSDHYSFWTRSYGAVMLIEAGSDFNRNYHTTKDVLDSLNLTFFHRMARLGIGSLAMLAGIEDSSKTPPPKELPAGFALNQNYPNPFNPATTIAYELPLPGVVRIDVFDMLGRTVATLVDRVQDAGRHSVTWNASGNASGVYVYRMSAGDFVQSRKMMIVH